MPATATIRSRRKKNAYQDLAQKAMGNGNMAVYNFARAVVKEAKIRVPKRTGYLASQIKWERIALGHYEIYVDGNKTRRTGAFYGAYVEYGTRHMAAQPYFTPAIQSQKAAYKAALKAIFR